MRKMIAFFVCSVFLFSCKNEKENVEEKTDSVAVINESKDYELGDSKFVDMGKKGFEYLASGDITNWSAGFADNALYRWNNGDSLSGKAAITDYWNKRMAESINKLTFSSDIWLSIKVNKPLTEGQRTGNYALCWNMVEASYKTGKSMKQRIHTVFHFNDAGKIDMLSQYLDRVPINAAAMK